MRLFQYEIKVSLQLRKHGWIEAHVFKSPTKLIFLKHILLQLSPPTALHPFTQNDMCFLFCHGKTIPQLAKSLAKP